MTIKHQDSVDSFHDGVFYIKQIVTHLERLAEENRCRSEDLEGLFVLVQAASNRFEKAVSELQELDEGLQQSILDSTYSIDLCYEEISRLQRSLDVYALREQELEQLKLKDEASGIFNFMVMLLLDVSSLRAPRLRREKLQEFL